MQQAAGNVATARSDDRQDILNSIVADLAALISHVQASIRLIETALARESSPVNQEAANVIVLDDVTPCYLHARPGLRACDDGLRVALRFLQHVGAEEFDASRFRPAHATV